MSWKYCLKFLRFKCVQTSRQVERNPFEKASRKTKELKFVKKNSVVDTINRFAKIGVYRINLMVFYLPHMDYGASIGLVTGKMKIFYY
jgi:hypothetical protein